jgi:hypothetical protein
MTQGRHTSSLAGRPPSANINLISPSPYSLRLWLAPLCNPISHMTIAVGRLCDCRLELEAHTRTVLQYTLHRLVEVPRTLT